MADKKPKRKPEGWEREFDPIEYSPDGAGDFFDKMMSEHAKRDKDIDRASLSRKWSRSRRKHDNPEKVVADLMEIRDAVRSLCRFHGLPKKASFELALLGKKGAGCAGFHDIGTWQQPYLFLDAGIYRMVEPEEVLDTYCGVGLHETAHVLKTRQMYERLKDGRLPRGSKRAMWEGLIEDERIEETVREESPGYGVYLHAAKRALFEKKEFGSALGKWPSLPDKDKALTIIFGFLRLPYLVTPEMKRWRTLKGTCVYAELRRTFPTVIKTESEVERYGDYLLRLWERLEAEYKDLEKMTDEELAEKLSADRPKTPPPPMPSDESVKGEEKKDEPKDDAEVSDGDSDKTETDGESGDAGEPSEGEDGDGKGEDGTGDLESPDFDDDGGEGKGKDTKDHATDESPLRDTEEEDGDSESVGGKDKQDIDKPDGEDDEPNKDDDEHDAERTEDDGSDGSGESESTSIDEDSGSDGEGSSDSDDDAGSDEATTNSGDGREGTEDHGEDESASDNGGDEAAGEDAESRDDGDEEGEFEDEEEGSEQEGEESIDEPEHLDSDSGDKPADGVSRSKEAKEEVDESADDFTDEEDDKASSTDKSSNSGVSDKRGDNPATDSDNTGDPVESTASGDTLDNLDTGDLDVGSDRESGSHSPSDGEDEDDEGSPDKGSSEEIVEGGKDLLEAEEPEKPDPITLDLPDADKPINLGAGGDAPALPEMAKVDPDILEEVKERRKKQKDADDLDRKHEEMFEAMTKAVEIIMESIAGAMGDTKAVSEVTKEGGEEASKAVDEKDRMLKKADDLKDEISKEREKKGRFAIIDMKEMVRRMEEVTDPLDAAESGEMAKAEEERLEMGESWDWKGTREYGEEYSSKLYHRRTVIVHPSATDTANRSRFEAAKASVRTHIARMRGVFQMRWGSKTFQQTELKEGRLHRKMIAKGTMTDRLFAKEYTKTAQGLELCLVLDESGSMGAAGFGGWYGDSRATRALQVATCIVEGVRGVPAVGVEAYSYASCGDMDKDCLIKCLYSKKKNPDPHSIGGYYHGAQNYDHMAIQTVTDLFLRNTKPMSGKPPKRMMIVLSDGAPAGTDYNGLPAIRATKKAVERAEKMGIFVLGIAIESYAIEQMYKHYLKYTDMSDLIRKMRNLVIQVVKSTT